MQARYYDPLIGRFYSNDPIGFRDVHSFNRYAYANNNPYKYTDPTGKVPEFVSARQMARNIGGSQGVATFDQAANEVGMEASGVNDLISAVSDVASGDLSGAATSMALAINKPAKLASKASKLQQKVMKGQSPKGIKRFDSSEENVPNSQDHVHFDDGTSLNVDGTVHDKKNGTPNPTNKQQKFLKKEGWPTEAKKDE
ncbi:RHS repeat-associated core domain-containing protein [Shewanella sp. Isolate13]|uniref:RHS repeat-associated core domain-containing protein n=1 Tax=Shewanella sp. Isolate13 TaxID=2908531 RepID=UPI001EFD6FD1|nr:RHS repeat-associated core domain-containing protein [Shewanella sp. Isolate13]MCG9732325.1 RHS repeat-associated core domain-containing protein [Shewanella sp. Isolate13]